MFQGCLLFLVVVTFISVVSSSTYTWGSNFPQSCECMETGSSSSACSLFRCTCTCDINAGSCDYGCCCDPDCSPSQISDFQSSSICVDEGYSPDLSTLCYTSNQLSKINPHYPLSGNPTSKTSLNQALCVEKRNYAYKEEYYSTPALKSATIFGTSTGQKSYDYSDPATSSEALSASNYALESYISAFTLVNDAGYYSFNNSDRYLQFSNGIWKVPRVDYAGYCSSDYPVQFEVELESAPCVVSLASESLAFETQCQNDLSLDYFINSLVVARNADLLSSILSSSPNKNNTVPITLRHVMYEDFLSGVSTALSNSTIHAYISHGCNTQYLSSSSSSATSFTAQNCTPFESYLSYSISNSTDYSTLGICLASVKSVHYTIFHDASSKGTISDIIADVVLMDLYPSTLQKMGGTFQQSISVNFSSNVASSQINSNGNVESRPRSGNPGYLIGKPIVFSTSPSNASDGLVLESNGIQVPWALKASVSSASSSCPSSSTLSKSLWTMESLKYGYDISTGCSLALNRNDLKAFCCQGSTSCSSGLSPYVDGDGIPFYFNLSLSEGYVGIYGNADPLDLSQWYSLGLTGSITTNKAWDDSTSTCSNVISGMHYKFLVAKSGEKYNPQMKIVAASVSYSTSSWVLRTPYPDNTTTQSFGLITTVSFIDEANQNPQSYVPPSPPVLFQVPSDVFYPFQQNSGSSLQISSLFSGISIMIAGVLVMFCV